MKTQTYRRNVSSAPVMIFSRPSRSVFSVLVRSETEVDISVGGPCEFGRGLRLHLGEVFAVSRQDVPASDDNFEIWAVSDFEGTVTVVEVSQ